MDKYIKCLLGVNNKARESSIADFEFSEAREAVIFSQWMGAVLPADESKWFSLPSENEGHLPTNFDAHEEWEPLFSESIVYSNKVNSLLHRRYVSFITPTSCSQVIGDIVKRGLDPQTFILVELDKEKYPKYNESFWKYVAGCILRRKGYLVTKKSPCNMRGCPDMTAYKSPEIINPLRKYKLIGNGCFLIELELPLKFIVIEEKQLASEADPYSVAVIEAKDERGEENRADEQLTGYLTHKDNHYYFDIGYITGPDFEREHRVGVISNAANGEPLLSECKRKTPYSWSESKLKALSQAEMLVKLVLAKNLPISRLQELCKQNSFNKTNFKGFLDEVSSTLELLTLDELCSLSRRSFLDL